jgi:hypothetical protein
VKLKADYRVSHVALAKVAKDKLFEAATSGLLDAWIACPSKQQKTLFKRLTLGQRAIPLLQILEGEICNGGFHQFFWNSSGNNCKLTLEALRAIRAEEYSSIFQTALDILLAKGDVDNRQQRQRALQLKPKNIFDGLDDHFYRLNDHKSTSLGGLCEKYFESHPEDFFLPAGTLERTESVRARDYRLPSTKYEKLTDENIHWLPIEKIWDDYWEAIRGEKDVADQFVVALTPGQRALIVIQILRNQFTMGGIWEFLTFSLSPDIFMRETRQGYSLLKAEPYSDVINECIEVGADVIAQTSQMTAIGHERTKLKLRGENEAVKNLGQQYMGLHKSRIELGKQLAEKLVRLDEKFKGLMDSADTKIENYIRGYLVNHRAEFFKS